jgi:hypothetical protein
VTLEQREKRLLEALYARYDAPDFFPTFVATWVEQEDGRRYFHVTGGYRSFSGEMIDYDHTISQGAFLQLEQEGYIRRDDRGAGEFSISITEAGKALVESDFR